MGVARMERSARVACARRSRNAGTGSQIGRPPRIAGLKRASALTALHPGYNISSKRRMTMGDAAGVQRFRYIGAKRRTKEDPRFVTGRGRYAADIALPGLHHVALVASPHASARIVSIRTDAARAMPGVRAVVTGEEFCTATDSLP